MRDIFNFLAIIVFSLSTLINSQPVKLEFEYSEFEKVFELTGAVEGSFTNTARFPVFSDNSENKVANKINADIAFAILGDFQGDILEGLERSFNETSTMFAEFMGEDNGMGSLWFSDHNISVDFQSDNIISLTHAYSEYMGGAHGMYNIALTSYDKSNGRALVLADIIDMNYEADLNKIGELYFRQAAGIDLEASLSDEGFWIEDGGFAVPYNFNLIDGGVQFFFNLYSIAPYSAGSFEFVIPYADLALISFEGSYIFEFLK